MKSHGSMNRVYRLIWSEVLNGWVAVAETSRGRGKGSSRKLIAAALSLCAAFAQAAPDGGQIISGAGSVTQSGATTTIQQASQNLSLNWKSFNIAPPETVNFVQPSASAIAVNRIFDTSGTKILGQLNANGQVYLINPNGILFGQGAQVNVGGLVASTLDLNDASLNGTTRSFSGNGTGSVVNQGTINATGSGGTGGYVALLGNTVSNQGTITAPLGAVALGAGSAATLTFSGNSLVKMQVDQSVLNSLAENGGLIRADGGQVIMNAGAKNALLASVVNNTGVVEARTVENHAGSIILLGGMTAGTAKVGGTLDASAPSGGNGGFIETSAAHVKVADDAKVTTAAAMGLTGTWLIDPTDYTIATTGGNITGTALSTNLGSTSVTILSSGGGTAGAGNINVNDAVSWSANTLTLTAANNININAVMTASGTSALVMNTATANGTDAAVAGGSVKVGMDANGFTGRVDFPGRSGTGFLTINGAGYTVINSLGAQGSTTGADLQGMSGNLTRNYALGSNIDATATSGWNGGAGFTPLGNYTATFDGLGHTIRTLTINRLGFPEIGLFRTVGNGGTVKNVGLDGGSVTGGYHVGGLVGLNYGTIANSYATGAVTGSAFSVGGLVGANAYSYFDSYYGTISNSYATGAVTGASFVGGLVGSNSGTISNSYATGAVAGSGYHVGGLVGLPNDLSTVSNSYYNIDAVMINGVLNHVTPYGLYNTQYRSWFDNNKVLSIANYASTTLPLIGGYYQISSTQGLKDLLGFANNPTYKFRLTANLNLAGISNDLTPNISGWHIPYFAGLEFDGAGYTLNNLAINQPFNERIGFIGTLASSSLLGNLGLTNVSVTGSGWVGGLVGENKGTISNTHATGTMTGYDYIGGLVGLSAGGSISNSYSSGVVSGKVFSGGLVGLNNGPISNSYSTAAVTDGEFGFSGGLVGEHDGGTISNSYATGAVTGRDINVGGLVGGKYGGDIINSYATGPVTGTDSVGGLVGYNQNPVGIIDNSHATGPVTGIQNVGGLVGSNYGAISNSYATGAVTGTGSVGGLVGYNDNDNGIISTSYAAGTVTGSGDYVGGLVGENSGGIIRNSYATGAVSGSNYVGGLVGSNDYGDDTINNTYAAGAVTGSGSEVGGLVGYNGGTINHNFWDSSVNATGIGSGTQTGATAMTTAPMKQQVNFTHATSANGNVAPGWDFNSTWRIYDGHTYPLLQVFLRPFTITATTNGVSNASQVYNGIPYSGVNGITCSSGACSNADSHLFNTAGFIGTSQGAINVGSYTVISDAFSDQQGYNITFVNGALTINKAHLTVTADNKSRLYGQANPALTSTVSGFVNGETAGTAAGFAGAGSATTLAGLTTGVGTALITAGAGNLAATNYAFTNLVDGTLTITPAAPTVNPNAPPVNFATPPAPVLNAMAQLQSEALFYRMNNEPQTLNLSPTLNVTQSAGAGSAAPSSESVSPAAGSTRMNVNTLMNVNTIVMGPSLQIMNIGATGTTLQIVNGGMRLPDTLANEN